MAVTKKIGLIALLASLSWGAQAANFNYNYGQLGYETGDFAGLTLTGSFPVDEQIFVIARYSALTNDLAGVDVDYTDISVGAGFHMPINAKTDAVYTISFDSAEVDVPAYDDTGILLTAGIRHQLNAKVELAGGIYHQSTFDGDTGLQAEARYNINNKMSAGISYVSSDFADGLGLNFRMAF